MKENKSKPTVAEYITAQIGYSGKSQLEIARECDFPKPNMITMIKQGRTKLPIAKIGLMATSLGIDPLHLYKIVMEQYEPENWSVVQNTVLKQPVLTTNELEIIDTVRKSNVVNPKLRTDAERNTLIDFISTLKGENQVVGD